MRHYGPRNIDIDTFDDTANIICDMDARASFEDTVKKVFLRNKFDETPSVIIPKAINHKYQQINKLKGFKRFFSIYNDVYLHQSIGPSKDEDQTRINLTYINPKPTRTKHIPWNLLQNALTSIFIGALFIFLYVFSEYGTMYLFALPFSALFTAMGILLLTAFFYRTQDKLVFHSFAGNVPLIEIFDLPKQVDYQTFIDLIKLHIKQAQQRQGLSMKQRLKLELIDLRRLSEDGLIPTETYEQARNSILKNKDYQAEQ